MNKVILFLLNFIYFTIGIKVYNYNYISYKKIRSNFLELYNIKQKNKFSLEHIIPKSFFNKKHKFIKNEMHNLLIYPNKMNIYRSNFKMVSKINIDENSKILNEKGILINYNKIIYDKYCISNYNKKLFYPCKKYHGEIARACAYFIYKYPYYKDIIFEDIISPETIINWNNNNISLFEYKKNYLIYNLQGDTNIFISNNTLLNLFIKEIL